MKMTHFSITVAVAVVLVTGTGVHANVAGGGNTGADVTLTDNGSSVTLVNGVVTATIDKGSGKVTSMFYGGKQVVQS